MALTINIVTMTGNRFPVEVQKDTTVRQLKEIVCEKDGIPIAQQRLVYNGQVLKDENTVAEGNIENGSSVHMTVILRGGL